MKQFSQEEILRAFYISGAIIFLIVGIANTYTNFVNWGYMILSAKVSALCMNLFNYVLATFFYLLLKQMKTLPLKPIEEKDADEIFQEALNE